MATMYALPGLSFWADEFPGGWSNTSGGPNNSTWPTNTTDVIFDASSGSSRTIQCAGTCKSLNTTGSSPMIFASSAGSGSISASGNVNLTGTISVGYMVVNPSSNPISLTSAGVPIARLETSAGGTITLLDDLNVTTLMGTCNTSFNANGKNVTAPTFMMSGAGQTLTMGSGTWTLTGTGSGPTLPVFSIPAADTVVCGTSTVKFTNTSAAPKYFDGGGKTYYNFLAATGVAAGGEARIVGANIFNDIKINPGATLYLESGVTNTVASITADGTGSQITISSSSAGSPATLVKSGGGAIYVDYCSIKDIAASPGSTFFARNSINVSGNTNWTFIPGNSKFLQFL